MHHFVVPFYKRNVYNATPYVVDLWFFLAVQMAGMQRVRVVFLDHTPLLCVSFGIMYRILHKCLSSIQFTLLT